MRRKSSRQQPLAPFPPLVKTRRDKRFDPVMPSYPRVGPRSRVSAITYVWKRRSQQMGGKEKWSASRAVKVVSLANETNIRADRVDKRRVRGAQGGAEAGEKETNERRLLSPPDPRSNSRRSFRFLYNRFNLILALDRSGGCERRKNIYFRGVSDPSPCSRSGITACMPAIFPLLFLARSSILRLVAPLLLLPSSYPSSLVLRRDRCSCT